MSRKIFYTFKIPEELFVILNDTQFFFLRHEVLKFGETTETDPNLEIFARNFRIFLKNNKKKIDNLIVTYPGDIKDIYSACTTVFKDFIVNSFPPVPDKTKIKSSFTNLFKRLNIKFETAIDAYFELKKTKKKILEIEKEQWAAKTPPFTSKDYSEFLEKVMLGQFWDDFNLKENKKFDIIRIGLVGIFPVISDIYDFFEENGMRVVYNEYLYESSFLKSDADFFEKYANFTLPYGLQARVNQINKEIKKRKIKGIINIYETFGSSGMFASFLEKGVGVPVLNLEVNEIGKLDQSQKIRIEAFGEMLRNG